MAVETPQDAYFPAGLVGMLRSAAYGWDLTPQENTWVDNLNTQFNQPGGMNPNEANLWNFLTSQDPNNKGKLYEPAPEYEVDLFKRLGQYANRAPTPEEQQVLSGYQSMLNRGYTPEELNAMKVSSLEGSRAQADSARNAMLMNARRTGNTAGQYGAMARAMQTGANAPSSIIRDLEIANANMRQANTRTGLEGIGNYNQQLLGRQMGATNAQTQMAQNIGQRQLEYLNQAQGLTQNAANRQQGYANLGVGLTNALRQNKQFGMTGLNNLYNTNVANQSDLYGKLAALLGTRTQDETNMGKKSTSFWGT